MAVEIRAATYAALRIALAAGTYQAGQMVFVESIDGTNTNGAGIFKVKYNAGGGFVDDGGVTLTSADGKWAAERLLDGPAMIEHWGASPSLADNSTAIQTALDWLQDMYDAGTPAALSARGGTYSYETTLRLGNAARKTVKLSFVCAGKGVTIFEFNGADDEDGFYIGQNTNRRASEVGTPSGTGETSLVQSTIGGFSVVRGSGTGGTGLLIGAAKDNQISGIDVDGNWGRSVEVWGRTTGYGQAAWNKISDIVVHNPWTSAEYGFLSGSEAASNLYSKITVWSDRCQYPFAERGFWNTWVKPVLHESSTASGNTRTVGGYYIGDGDNGTSADRNIFIQPECEVSFTGSQAAIVIAVDGSNFIQEPIAAGKRWLYAGSSLSDCKAVFLNLEDGNTVTLPNVFAPGKNFAMWNTSHLFRSVNRTIGVAAANIGVSSSYGAYQTLYEVPANASSTINSVRITNNTDQSVDVQFRTRDRLSSFSTNNYVKTVASGASYDFTAYELGQILIDDDVTDNWTARIRTAAGSVTGTVDFWFGGTEFVGVSE